MSYACYRFECSLRSAAVLGIIGAGGVGYEIFLSLQSPALRPIVDRLLRFDSAEWGRRCLERYGAQAHGLYQPPRPEFAPGHCGGETP